MAFNSIKAENSPEHWAIIDNLVVLVLVICINISAFDPNLHISQMTLLLCKLLHDVINMYNLQKYYATI